MCYKEKYCLKKTENDTHKGFILCKAAEEDLSVQIKYEHTPQQREKVNLVGR